MTVTINFQEFETAKDINFDVTPPCPTCKSLPTEFAYLVGNFQDITIGCNLCICPRCMKPALDKDTRILTGQKESARVYHHDCLEDE